MRATILHTNQNTNTTLYIRAEIYVKRHFRSSEIVPAKQHIGSDSCQEMIENEIHTVLYASQSWKSGQMTPDRQGYLSPCQTGDQFFQMLG